MAGDARWSCLAEHLPAKSKENSWACLTLEVAGFLIEVEHDEFCAMDVVEAVHGKSDQSLAISIGGLISKLPGAPRPKETTRRGRKANFHRTSVIRRILHFYGVLVISSEKRLVLNPLITGDLSVDVNELRLTSIETHVPPSFYPSSFIPPYLEPDLNLLEERWIELHRCSFRTSLVIAKQILNDSVFDLDFYPDAFPCLRFTQGRQNDYATVTQQYLDAALPDQDFCINDVPTKTAHRLISMIIQPDVLRRWDVDASLHVHHVCRNRDCVLPSHHVLMLQPLHQHLHKSEGAFDHGSITGDEFPFTVTH